MEHLRSQPQCLLHLTAPLGWTPSLENAELMPTEDFAFISMHASNRSRAVISPRDLVQRSSLSCSSSSLGKECYSSRFSLAAWETGFNVRDSALRPSPILTS